LKISITPSILLYFKTQALIASLDQGNCEEKYRGKLGKRELLVFNVDSVKYLCQFTAPGWHMRL